MAESFSREKLRHAPQKEKVDEKSCVTFLLCDPGWYVQLDVQNKWEENTHHVTSIIDPLLGGPMRVALIDRMIRMTGPDCTVMCNLINTHTHTQHVIVWIRTFA